MPDLFLNAHSKLEISDMGATPVFTEIPIQRLVPKLNTTEKDGTTNADVDSSGYLWDHTVVTKRGMQWEATVKRQKDATTNTALVAALAQIYAASHATGEDAEIDFRVTNPGDSAETWTCAIVDCKPNGDMVDDICEFTFTVKTVGPKQ